MKTYMKPTIEIIELRPEERLASCRHYYSRPSWLVKIIYDIFGWPCRCKSTWSSSCHCS